VATEPERIEVAKAIAVAMIGAGTYSALQASMYAGRTANAICDQVEAGSQDLELVEDCVGCPFGKIDPNRVCTYGGDVRALDASHLRHPPPWCPLRKCAVTVALKEER
jgi:hypothetical protein